MTEDEKDEEAEEPVGTDEDEQEEVDPIARTALHLMPHSSFSNAFHFVSIDADVLPTMRCDIR